MHEAVLVFLTRGLATVPGLAVRTKLCARSDLSATLGRIPLLTSDYPTLFCTCAGPINSGYIIKYTRGGKMPFLLF